MKFLKAFAGANIADHVLAVFDNDTAGHIALRQAQALKLPHNLNVTSLPECKLAKDYPTIGPQGHHKMDVNRLAASIEMYLGKAALTENGELRPVRWTGYVANIGSYQGEVEGKRYVVEAFQEQIDQFLTPDSAQKAFPDLAGVWRHLISIIEQTHGRPFLTAWETLEDVFAEQDRVGIVSV